MWMPGAIRPYLAGAAALAVAAATLGYGSLRWQAGYVRGSAALDQVMRRASDAESDVARLARALDEASRLAAAERASAEAARAAARAAAARAAQDRQHADAEAAAWRAKFDEATRAPSCRVLMETKLCGVTSY